MADAKRSYTTSSIVTTENILFNVRGNAYRPVVAVDFDRGIVWIKWIGTHRNYDKIDVTEVDYETRLKPVRSEVDYESALVEVERLWGAKSGTPDGDRLDILATLIDAYEAERRYDSTPARTLGISADVLIRPSRFDKAA